jgi:hypothetical protein
MMWPESGWLSSGGACGAFVAVLLIHLARIEPGPVVLLGEEEEVKVGGGE